MPFEGRGPLPFSLPPSRSGRRVRLRRTLVLRLKEADRHGVMMTPTVVVDGEVVATGRGLTANRLEQLLERHLGEREEGGEGKRQK